MRRVRTLYTAMMVLLAKATDRELARMVSYLKEENRILRARCPSTSTRRRGSGNGCSASAGTWGRRSTAW